MNAAGAQSDVWFTAEELAELRLPGVPQTKRRVTLRAVEHGWRAAAPDGSPQARQVRGQGGLAWEYHVKALPSAAREELVRRGALDAPQPAPANVSIMPRTAVWAEFERKTAKDQAEAARRLALIQAVESHMTFGGTGKTRAIDLVAASFGAKPSTIYNYFKAIRGLSPHDRLPALAPDFIGGGAEAPIDPELWKMYEGNYLRPTPTTHAACYELVRCAAVERGIKIPSAKTFQRKLERETDPAVVIACRQGKEAIARRVPPQERSTLHMQAMDMVNIDGHRWDVFVRFPDGTVARPLMVAIQDIRSRKMLAWRIDINETAYVARLAFADLFRDHGIPKSCLLDNGRAFASKWISGGAKTRFRFKILPDDPLGLLPALGIENRWATPYHGQAKPIERAFRDMCEHIAKHPAFDGAWTGNNPMAKPEDYGSRAVPFDVFKKVVDSQIAAHNARPGRRGKGLLTGESFDQAYARTLGQVGVATPEDMRLALFAAEIRTAHAEDGSLNIYGNRYWADGMARFAGQKLTVRFDPENLHTDGSGGVARVFAYSMDGSFLMEVPLWEAVGFDSADAGKKRAKQMGDHRRAVKHAVKLADIMSAEDIAARLPEAVSAEVPRPNIIRPVRVRGNAAVALRPDSQIDATPIDFMDRMAGGLERTAALRLVADD